MFFSLRPFECASQCALAAGPYNPCAARCTHSTVLSKYTVIVSLTLETVTKFLDISPLTGGQPVLAEFEVQRLVLCLQTGQSDRCH
jgi:hypothetical protein